MDFKCPQRASMLKAWFLACGAGEGGGSFRRRGLGQGSSVTGFVALKDFEGPWSFLVFFSLLRCHQVNSFLCRGVLIHHRLKGNWARRPETVTLSRQARVLPACKLYISVFPLLPAPSSRKLIKTQRVLRECFLVSLTQGFKLLHTLITTST